MDRLLPRPVLPSTLQKSKNDTDHELRCPVCKGIYRDPYYVCKNHHTLCLACHEGVKATAKANHEVAVCPVCRDSLAKPVENSLMSKLIRASRSNPKLSATCEMVQSDCPCERPVLVRCEHCDKNLCDLHFSAHRMKFEDDCQKLLKQAQQDAREAAQVGTTLKPWNALISDLIEFFKFEKERLELLLKSSQRKADIADSLQSKGQDADALKQALLSGNLRAARARFDQLTAIRTDTDLGSERIGLPPTDQQREEINAAKNAIDALVGVMTGICGGVEDADDEYDEDIYS